MELVCPAGTLQALKAAVDAGADAVYCGFNDSTNARNFPGLNLSGAQMKEGIVYAHDKHCKVYVALNAFARNGDLEKFHTALEKARGADAVILSDLGVLRMAKRHFPEYRIHLSVQATAASAAALDFYREEFGVKRAVLPRILDMEAIRRIIANTSVEVEVFGFGSLCQMAEGKCYLSQYVAGKGSNLDGVCSPAEDVRYETAAGRTDFYLGDTLLGRFDGDDKPYYPTVCKGLYEAGGRECHVFSLPASLQAFPYLRRFAEMGVSAVKIEGRQRSKSYVAEVIRLAKGAIKGEYDEGAFLRIAEGRRMTLGAYDGSWQ